MTIISGPNIVTNGLVVYVDAANPRSYRGSGLAWNDIGPQALTLTFSGSPNYSTLNIGYFSFDGSQSASVTPLPAYSNNTGVTASAWINVNSGSTRCIVSHSSSPANNDGWRLVVRNNGLGFSLGGVADYDSGIPIADGTWKHVAITATSSSVAYYVNGSQVSSSSPLASITGTPASLTIGNDPIGESMVGLLSSVSLYRRVLQDTEIAQNFNALRGRYSL